MDLKITPSGQTIVKPTALGPVANTDTKLLICGLFQEGRVLAQDGGGARERNVGWRIDYVLASPSAMKRLKDAFIWPNERGSDHCSVGVDIDL